jgi:ATP-binding cassette subfamily C protein
MTGVAAEHAIRQMAESANVRLRNVHYEEGWWRQANGYFIAFRAADERPVAILPSIRGGLKIVDPVENRSTAVNSKTASTLSAKGFQVYRPLPEVRMKPGQLLEFSMKGCEKELATIVMMGVAVGLLGTIPPIFMGRLVDSVIPGAQHSELLQLTLIVVAVAISTALFMTTRIYALLRLEGKIDGPLQAAVWDRLLRLPSTFFRNFQAGDLADRSIGISEVRRILTGSTLSSILSGLFSTFNLALLFYFSPLLALVACGLVGVAVAVSVTSVLIQIRIQRRLSTLRGQLSGIVLQLISGITKFRVCGAERRAFAIWAKLYAKQKEFAVKSRRVSNVLTIFNAAFPLICLGMLFLCASQLLPNGVEGTVASLKTGLTTGAFIAFLAAFTQFMGATLELSYTLVSVLHVVPLIERVSPILSTMPELDGVQTHPGQMSGHIEVSRLAFRYKPDTPPVLRDVSFAVNPGQSIALIGTSGCGKSTLLRILLGFEQPGAGAVYYDGQDLAGLDILAVRRQIGVVLQNGRLMDGSILTNIIGSSSLTIEDAWEAARLAGIADEIRQMRDGMHTVLAEGGAALSGGQRQRIMIARAIVKKPRILFFDEGTSALDNRTQAVVTESLAQLKATRIIVAHRLSTVMDADQLIVLEKGTVVEAGKYDELMARQGAFHQIAARQIM